MKKESLFPDWFKNILIGVGVFSLFEFVRGESELAKQIPRVALLYPLILFFIYAAAKTSDIDEREQYGFDHFDETSLGIGKHIFNISLSIMGFLTLILLVDFKTYIKQASTFPIAGYSLTTDNSNIRVVIYILMLLYFLLLGGYLSCRIKYWFEYYEGKKAFETGYAKIMYTPIFLRKTYEKFIYDNKIILSHFSDETKKALKYFDIAIAKKYYIAGVFAKRGNCLHYLGFYFDAIEDYNNALVNNTISNKANIYYMRGISKYMIFDYEGSLMDIEKAIDISKLEDRDYRNGVGYDTINVDSEIKSTIKKLGYDSVTAFYERERDIVARDFKKHKEHPMDRTDELKKIKRRKKITS